ncbi:MAG TPA: ATP-binding protein [Terracidiphilus sp.]|nr:ATP-binding protein [Terracidiphilus sp.]
MSWWNPRTISGKLTRINLLMSGTALVLAYLSFLAYDLYTLRGNLIRTVTAEARIVGENLVTALMFDDQQAATATLSALQSSPQIQWAAIVRPDGLVFARYVRNAANPPDVGAKLAPGRKVGQWERGQGILLASRIEFEGKQLGEVYLLAETTDLARSAAEFGLISAGILLLCFLVALLLTSAIRRLLTEPLSSLAETAQAVSRERDYSVRAKTPRSGDELAALVQSFNEMLEQIQDRDRALESSRVDLEERVRERTAELTAANKELEAFTYSVAHDLRGPLQQINNIGFLLGQVEEQYPTMPQTRELIEKLSSGTRRMSMLIEDLLNLSRASSTPLHRTPIDLSSMAEEILTGLKAENGGRQVSVNVEKGARAIADEGLVHVVLENLLQNAWKYTSKMSAAEIGFGFTEEPSGPVFFVHDNGAGFNPQYADRLFKPFQRLHSQSEFPGTGIGLATAYRIITRHGGRIWAKGKVNAGADFYFTLPYVAEP